MFPPPKKSEDTREMRSKQKFKTFVNCFRKLIEYIFEFIHVFVNSLNHCDVRLYLARCVCGSEDVIHNK